MKTCLASDPQIPVIRVLAITHCRRDGWGSSISTSFIGVRANPTRRGLDSSGAAHVSGFTPYSSPFTTPTTYLSDVGVRLGRYPRAGGEGSSAGIAVRG